MLTYHQIPWQINGKMITFTAVIGLFIEVYVSHN